MIKLIVTLADQPPVTYTFDQSSIIIGSKDSSADVVLPGELAEKHLQINAPTPDGVATVINLAHDPFVTLNDLPFGKRPLQHNDSLQIGNVSIRIEVEAQQTLSPSRNPKAQPSTTLSNQDVEALVQQVEDLVAISSNEKNENVQPIESKEKNIETIVHSTPSPEKPTSYLKDLKEFDEPFDDRIKRSEPKVYTPTPSEDLAKDPFWTNRLSAGVTFFGIFAILLTLIYLWFNDKSAMQEIKAAKNVSDIAMALTYAQVMHIHPQNQNWSDPEFMKHTLQAILSPEYASQADYDSHGQFTSSPYMLRIYTSGNSLQFLVIAQPAPSVLQWLIPKATIVIDSHTMEMRKIKDLKTLNRLLLAASLLEGTHANEISSLIKQGELISLSSLANSKNHHEFSPPKTISSIDPDAENYVYNAPRYYLFGENLMHRVLASVNKPGNNMEQAVIQQQMETLSRFPHLIFYSSTGVQQALQAKKALTLLSPENNFLIAYLQKDDEGKIEMTHLLTEDEMPTALAEEYISEEEMTTSPIMLIEKEEPKSIRQEVDEKDPLYMRLVALNTMRKNNLAPIANEMVELINKHTDSPQLTFAENLKSLQTKYFIIDQEQRKYMVQDLGNIIRDTYHLPITHIVEFIKATDLQPYLQDYLILLKQRHFNSLMTHEEIEQQLNQIELSTNWQELEASTNIISLSLKFENVPDEEALIAYQNSARIHVLQKLNVFLLSPDSHQTTLSNEAFMPEYRQILMNILEAAWIIDPDTYNFYLMQFDLRSSQNRSLAS